ncbi:MAG: peptidyl-tRNA hydrolase [Bacteroidota bacterium]|jgi:PTH1 family peptidyl-tRNA hydrolase
MKFLIVGLGNIGHEYNNTRHNIGFDVVNFLAAKHGGTWRTARYADVAEIKVKGKILILIKPSTYMNLSGNAVRYWMQEEKISATNTMIITDDLALPFGKLRMRPKGSDGGHNGLKHIQSILGNDQYPRLRFGVGSEFSKGKQVDYVLGVWNEEELKTLETRIEKAAEGCLLFTQIGLERAMNVVNAS